MNAKVERKICALLILSIVFCLAGGCGISKEKDNGGMAIAKINKYVMTVDDFKDEAGLVLGNRPLSEYPEETKKELLDDSITKKVLIQEAQKQNFDKEKSFMKEIERYWEQALLKLLLRKKTNELTVTTRVDENEVMLEYGRLAKEEGAAIEPYEKLAPEIRNEIRHRKIQAALDKWMNDLKAKSDIKIYRNNLDKIKIEQ